MDSNTMDDNESLDWSVPMWNREKPTRFWSPGPKLIKSIRQYQHLNKSTNPLNIIRTKLCVFRHRFWSVVTGAEIDMSCSLGGGLLIPHPNGIVIHPSSTIGHNCLILQQVTLANAVELGYHVDIGAGAKIIGPLKIGNHARIGANAVVTKDVGAGETVVGIPARKIN